jgi:uncharacterized low-complexity protein
MATAAAVTTSAKKAPSSRESGSNGSTVSEGSFLRCWVCLRRRRGRRGLAALQVGVGYAVAVLTGRTLRLRRAERLALIAVALDIRADFARSTLACAGQRAAPTPAATAAAADGQQNTDGAHASEGDCGGVSGVHERSKRTIRVGFKAKARENRPSRRTNQTTQALRQNR